MHSCAMPCCRGGVGGERSAVGSEVWHAAKVQSSRLHTHKQDGMLLYNSYKQKIKEHSCTALLS